MKLAALLTLSSVYMINKPAWSWKDCSDTSANLGFSLFSESTFKYGSAEKSCAVRKKVSSGNMCEQYRSRSDSKVGQYDTDVYYALHSLAINDVS